MMNVEIRFVSQGREVSVDSFVETIVREIRASVREEIDRTFSRQVTHPSESSPKANSEIPVQAVSIGEAARLLSISTRTVYNYIGVKGIRTIRIGRRVLIPMRSVNEVASRGILRRRVEPTAATPV